MGALKSLAIQIVVCVIAAAVIALAAYWTGRIDGKAAEREKWKERQLVAERAARQTETDLAGIAEASAKRIAEKERLLDERARERDEEWKRLLAGLPRCRLPARVGVHLNAAAGVSSPAGVASPPQASADGADPDPEPTIGADVVADACRKNNESGLKNGVFLDEAEAFYARVVKEYEAFRNRVNAGATP